MKFWVLNKHTSEVTCAISSTDNHIYSSSVDGIVVKSNIISLKSITFGDHTSDVVDLALSSDNTTLYSVGKDGKIFKINAVDMTKLAEYKGNVNQITKIILSKDNNTLYMSNILGEIHKINTSDMTQSNKIQASDESINSIALSNDDSKLYAINELGVYQYGTVSLAKTKDITNIGTPDGLCVGNNKVFVSVNKKIYVYNESLEEEKTINYNMENPQNNIIFNKDFLYASSTTDIVKIQIDTGTGAKYNLKGSPYSFIGDIKTIKPSIGDTNQILVGFSNNMIIRFNTNGTVTSTFSFSVSSTPPSEFGTELIVTREGIQLDSLGDVEQGIYHVKIKKKGYKTVDDDVNVNADKIHKEYTLEKSTRRLRLTVIPKGSLVKIYNSENIEVYNKVL